MGYYNLNPTLVTQIGTSFKPSYPPEDDSPTEPSTTASEEEDELKRRRAIAARNRNRVEFIPTGKIIDGEAWKKKGDQGRAAMKRGEYVDKETADAVAFLDELEHRDQDGWEQSIRFHAALEASKDEARIRRQKKKSGRQSPESQEDGDDDGASASQSGLETAEPELYN
ncbi:hypothetical protein PQX77_002981 [Marasmius sp. AFHP31]|nr:hypothetical protein PQX77_002981 [Marasmius sp. AFHP31]